MDQDKVKLFFNNSEYLKNSSDRIAIRSMVVQDFLGDTDNLNILDIGCGDGSLSLPMLKASNRLTLIDLSDAMIRKVKERIPENLASNVTLINDSFEAVDDNVKFDVVLCVGVIAHVPDVATLLKKIDTVLKPGGRLIVETTPNPYPIGKLFFPYYFLRNLIFKDAPKYSKNRMKIKDLLAQTDIIGLKKLRAVRYSFPLPGMSHWPQSLKFRYTLMTLTNPLLSRIGSEHIFLLKR